MHKAAIFALALGGILTQAHRPPAPDPATTDRAPERATARGLRVAESAAAKAGTPAKTNEPPAGLSREEWGQIRGLVAKGQYHAASVATPEHLTALETFVQEAKLLGSDSAAHDLFGSSAAVSGDTVVVGAEGDTVGVNTSQGSAYVFVRSGGVWSEQQKLVASDGTAYDYFGGSVAASGDTVLVGAYGNDVGATDQGSAYVFVRSGGVWSEQQKLVASDGTAYDYFGISVSVSRGTAVVGASGDDGANYDQGAAYVFVRNGGVWSQQQKLVASDGASGDGFGYPVSVSGDTVVVGAYGSDVGANGEQGSAYVFVRSGGVWSQQQKLVASDGASGDGFGHSASVSGDTAVVGAPGDNVGANRDQGSVYAFVRSGGDWSQQQKLVASDGTASDYFGWSVSLSGDAAVVGAYQDDVGAYADRGSAYVFVKSGGDWSQQQKLVASDGAAGDGFGVSVSVSGDAAVAGAYSDYVGANPGQGSAYVFSADLIFEDGFQ